MKTSKRLLVAVLSLAAMGATSAMAADLGGSYKDAPTYVAEYGPGWMIRGRILGVIPNEDTSNWRLDGTNIDALGPDAAIDNSIVPELDFTYFFNNNIAVEVIAGVTPHDITGKGLLAGTKVGDVWLLPPTVLLQYHFNLGNGIKPYLGAGLNYTVFFNEDAGSADYSNLKIDNAFGFAAQAGVDFHLEGNWFLNVDVKKIWLDTELSVGSSSYAGTVKTDVDVDPLIVGVGLGYRFGGGMVPLK
jgi:outer membrane protein